MDTIVQWIHVSAAVIGVGGIVFLALILIPSARTLIPEHRDVLMKSVLWKFRWVSWVVILLLLLSGLYNVRWFYWDRAWGPAWALLTLKIVLAFALFAISFVLTLPFNTFERFRARREFWLLVGLALGFAVIFISAYLRRV